MEKATAHLTKSNSRGKPRRASLATMATLTRWRLRLAWRHLLMIGVALLAACTIACIPALFSPVVETAGLQELFNATPDRTVLALNVTANNISSTTVPATLQSLEKIVRSGMGSFLDPAPAPLVIQASKVSIMQPERLNHTNPLNVYATSIQHIRSALRLVQGSWASEDISNGMVEFMLTAETAQALKLNIGDVMTLQSGFVTPRYTSLANPQGAFTARLVGTFASPPANAPGLYGATFQPVLDYTGLSYTMLLSGTAFLQTCDQIAARESSDFVTAGNAGSPFHLTWYYHVRSAQLQFGQTDALTSRLASVQYKVTSSFTNGGALFPYAMNAEFTNPTSDVDMLTLLNQYASRVTLMRVPLSLLALQTVALLLFFACLLVNQLVDRQMNMSALLSSRGASPGQVRWSLIAQGAGLCVLALVVGPLLGGLLVYKLTAQMLPTDEQGALHDLVSSPQHMLELVAPYLFATFLVSLLAISLPCLRASTVHILELRREAARTSKQPFWLRYYLDLLAALLAFSSVGTTLYLAQIARGLDIQTQELVIAPLTLVAPLFLLLGALLLFLRVFPFVLRFAARLTRPARGTISLLALVQMARNPGQATRLIMLLTLATTFASFALILSASQSQRALDIAAYESGADFSGNLPTNLLTQIQQELAQRYNEPPSKLSAQIQQAVMQRYSKIPGVLAASAGYTSAGSATGLGGSQVSLTLRAVDIRSFASAATWNMQDSDQPVSNLLDILRQRESTVGLITPAIVDEATMNNLHLKLGDTFDFTSTIGLIGGTQMSFQVIAVVQHIPGANGSAGAYNNASSDGLLVDFQAFNDIYHNYQSQIIGVPSSDLQALSVNYLWLRASNTPGALSSVHTALSSPALALDSLYDRQAIAENLQSDPLVQSILLLLNIGGATAMILAFLASLLSSWLNVYSRLSNFVVLRALGATRRQVVQILLWEQGVVYLLALLFALLLVAVLAWLVVPQLVFTSLPSHGILSELNTDQLYLLQRSLAPQVIIPPTLQLALPIVVVACATALFLMARVVLKASYAQELRLNED